MASKALTLVFVLVTVAFAGCSGKAPAPTDEGPASSVSATADPIPDAGSIRGTVVDDSQLPMGGVTIAISKLNVEVVTDEAGAFLITNLAPGDYRVDAQKLGYASAAKSVTVGPNEEVSLTIPMVEVVVDEPDYVVHGPYNGFLVCGFAHAAAIIASSITWDCGAVEVGGQEPLGQQKNRFLFPFTRDDIHSIVGETQWTSSAAGTSSELQSFLSHRAGGNSHWWCSSAGASPTRFVWSIDEDLQACHDKGGDDSEPTPEKGKDGKIDVYLPFVFLDAASPPVPVAVTFQQRYATMATVFYDLAPEAEYTALPDN